MKIYLLKLKQDIVEQNLLCLTPCYLYLTNITNSNYFHFREKKVSITFTETYPVINNFNQLAGLVFRVKIPMSITDIC